MELNPPWSEELRWHLFLCESDDIIEDLIWTLQSPISEANSTIESGVKRTFIFEETIKAIMGALQFPLGRANSTIGRES